MVDSLPTVWDADPHTLAKHAILRGYLQAWMPILAHQSHQVGRVHREILFVDGFAGPGEYSGGQEGSPVIAIKAALGHSHAFPAPIRFVFIEKDEERHARLVQVLEQHKAALSTRKDVLVQPPLLGECDALLRDLLTKCQRDGLQFGPALVFLDQFGYSSVSMDLVKTVLTYSQCEVFSYLDWNWMNRFLSDDTKWSGITRAFGGDLWKPALEMGGREREQFLLKTYTSQLSTVAHAKYTWTFAMHGEGNKLLYWLFFSTNNIRGLEEMKKAMARVDDSGAGQFKFSDAQDARQLRLFGGVSDASLARFLSDKLCGKTMTVFQVKEFILTQTPCYLYNEALAILEREGRLHLVDPPKERRRGSFAKFPDLKVNFPPVQSSWC